MGTDNKSSSNPSSASKGKKRKHSRSYLPHNKPAKKKGSYPLHPGVQGFFITCDGGRESQASREAINVIDSYYEELVLGEDSGVDLKCLSGKPLNTKITFSYSDSSSGEHESDDGEEEEEEEEVVDEEKGEKQKVEEKEEKGNEEQKSGNSINTAAIPDVAVSEESDCQKVVAVSEESASDLQTEVNVPGPPNKKQCLKTDVQNPNPVTKTEKSVDKLIEEELKELGDKSKRRFVQLDSGCGGVVFIQMRKKAGDPGPTDIAYHMVASVASTKKHMSRFILRILPIEAACYASEEEITRAMKPIVEKYFPTETQNPEKFAVLYEARYNTGADRMKIINAVAKSIPAPHKVDLNNPNKTIIVEIVKTVCLIGIADKYKELAKYNLRQLQSSKA